MPFSFVRLAELSWMKKTSHANVIELTTEVDDDQYAAPMGFGKTVVSVYGADICERSRR
jgi:hypothetical protein